MIFDPDFSPEAVAELARALFGPENKKLSHRLELRFGRRGSIAVVPSRGVFFNFETGEHGGVFDMIVHGGAAADRRGAANFLRGGERPVPKREDPRDAQRRKAAAERERRGRKAVAAELWASGGALAGSVGENYLRSARAVSAPLGEAGLRFISAAPLTPYRPDHRQAPALVGIVANPRGVLIGAHLTYLAEDGSAKADLLSPRKMIGTIRGGHVPLIQGAVMVVAEGIESALSAWDVNRRPKGTPYRRAIGTPSWGSGLQ